MTADVAEATAAPTEDAPKKRGGPRGDRPWRDKPTPRERVLNQSLADFIKEVTGKDVSPETIRAVRFGLPKWSKLDSTTTLRENMDKKLEKAKLQDRREKALAQLKELDSELSKFSGEGDTDDDDDDDDDDTEEVEDSDDDPFDEDDDVSDEF
jgi:hypothetical protein